MTSALQHREHQNCLSPSGKCSSSCKNHMCHTQLYQVMALWNTGILVRALDPQCSFDDDSAHPFLRGLGRFRSIQGLPSMKHLTGIDLGCFAEILRPVLLEPWLASLPVVLGKGTCCMLLLHEVSLSVCEPTCASDILMIAPDYYPQAWGCLVNLTHQTLSWSSEMAMSKASALYLQATHMHSASHTYASCKYTPSAAFYKPVYNTGLLRSTLLCFCHIGL